MCVQEQGKPQVTDFGCSDSHDLFDMLQSRTMVLWGKNVFTSSVHLIPLLRQARQQGAVLILIDPVHHRTASLCDHVLQPRPGTDAAVSFGMARWLFDNAGADPAAAEYCDDFDCYHKLVMTRSMEQWATIADISPAALQSVARAYAARPAAILVGWGLQRRRFGATTIRCIDALAAVSATWESQVAGCRFIFAVAEPLIFHFVARRTRPVRFPNRCSARASCSKVTHRSAWCG